MKLVLWLLPILGSMASGLIVFGTMLGSASAPQEAAGYAMACAFSIVPYVFVRSVMAMTDDNSFEQLKKISGLLEKIEAGRDASD